MAETLIRQEPEDIINRVRPDHQSVEWFNGGDNRDVVVVDGREAFRFPKNEVGVEVINYEFEALKLLRGKLSVDIPEPIELAPDGAYNVLSFLPGKVLKKHEVAALPFEKRRDMGVAIAGVINELNSVINREALQAIPTNRSFVRSRDDYYAAIYQAALQQDGDYAKTYCQTYEHLQTLRPNGSASNIIVFGDFSSPNLILSDDDQLTGIVDWTELGFGDIHNELRPVFSVIGQQAFETMVASLDNGLGPVDQELVRLLAITHELGVLVNGKQKGLLTSERTKLAIDTVNSLSEGVDFTTRHGVISKG